jgi:hypothetical protein
MNKLLTLILVLLLLSSCEKNPVCEEPVDTHPRMHYTDLHNAEVKYQTFKRVDIDGDGRNDFLFSTLLVGDALGQRDRLQFYANSSIDAYQPVNEHEESPVLSKDAPITLQYPGFTWYDITAIVLAEKITLISGETYWDGLWKNASHKYLPVQVVRNGEPYLGWIEISFDTTAEKIILHKAAISTKAGKEVKAGY